MTDVARTQKQYDAALIRVEEVNAWMIARAGTCSQSLWNAMLAEMAKANEMANDALIAMSNAAA